MDKPPEVIKEPAHESVDSGLSFPSPEEMSSIEWQKLAKYFLDNHRKLINKVKLLGSRNIPYFGLHGLKKAGDWELMLATGKPYLQIVTSLKKAEDPITTLNDLYDVVGGSSYYFSGNEEQALMLLNLQQENHTIAHKWGDKGESKGWAIGSAGYSSGIVNKDFFEKSTGANVTDEEALFFKYFLGTGGYPPIESNAQKSDLNLPSEEIKNRVMYFLPTKDTKLYLLGKQNAVPEEQVVRHVLGQMLYVQSIIEKLLGVFKKLK